VLTLKIEILEGLQRLSTESVVVLVGLPGAGRTTYYRRFLEPLGYTRVAPQAGTGIETVLDTAQELLAQRKPVNYL
jgi:bifunctional polynucleotide phosphatase/kinase